MKLHNTRDWLWRLFDKCLGLQGLQLVFRPSHTRGEQSNSVGCRQFFATKLTSSGSATPTDLEIMEQPFSSIEHG